MDEFELTLPQVRNKIRIYRTTYAQELKKMENNKEYVPKLQWFTDLHQAFHEGKVKSFVKTPKKAVKTESIKSEIEIEFQEGTDDDEIGNDTQQSWRVQRVVTKLPRDAKGTPEIETSRNISESQYEFKKVGKIEDASEHQHIIIEPYEDEYEDEEPVTIQSTSNISSQKAQLPSGDVLCMQSNELFLKSLQSTLDKLPEDKNMRARIKIQEILYQIAYDK